MEVCDKDREEGKNSGGSCLWNCSKCKLNCTRLSMVDKTVANGETRQQRKGSPDQSYHFLTRFGGDELSFFLSIMEPLIDLLQL